MDNSTTISYFDLSAGDDFEASLTSNSGRNLDVYIGTILGFKSFPSEAYSSQYQTIRDCNIVIGEMKEEGTDEADKVRATAYAMRAACYYQLLRWFCDVPEKNNMANQLGVPLVTQFDMEERPVRSSMQAVVDLIESDLKKSIAYHVHDDLFRFTEDVSKGYLARLYFWTKQWDKVLPIADELLKVHPILPIDKYVQVMKEAYKLGTNQLIKSYRLSTAGNQTFEGDQTTARYRPISIRFLSHFSETDTANDVRYKFYVNKKRVVTKTYFCGMRSEEFKLMQAECYYHLGQMAEALAALNELRAARVKDVLPFTIGALPNLNDREIIETDAEGKRLTPLIGAILSERRKELFFEGDRFFELKRNGRPEFWTAYNGRKYTTLKYMYTFPIPHREIQINGGIVQNPGYTELESN